MPSVPSACALVLCERSSQFLRAGDRAREIVKFVNTFPFLNHPLEIHVGVTPSSQQSRRLDSCSRNEELSMFLIGRVVLDLS